MDWAALLARAPRDGWGDVVQVYLTPGGRGLLPNALYEDLSDVRTTSPRGMAVLGLLLADHHQAAGTETPWDVRARVLAGHHGLESGPLRDRAEAYLNEWGREATYQAIAAELEHADCTSAAYHYGSAVLSTVPYPP